MLDAVDRLDAALTEGSYTERETHSMTGVSKISIRRWLAWGRHNSQEPEPFWEGKIRADVIPEIRQQAIHEFEAYRERRIDLEIGRGTSRRSPNESIPDLYQRIHSDALSVSFIELIEILIVGSIRVATGKKFQEIRACHDHMSEDWRTPFPFAHNNFLEMPLYRGKFQDAVGKTLEQMDYKGDYVATWYPMGKEQPITVDPHRGSGAPVIKGRRVRVQDITGRFKAGESVDFIAYDFDLERTDVEAALRYALRLSL